jgi:predicted RNA-binding Zn-ribbon protein involved in translation (DUF1610 family)
MAISFQCPACGKRLKAPESAVGRSLACPGCETQVACPEPIYDAEVVGMDEVGTPDTMAARAPEDAPSNQTRRPCPMCGEMIVATAAKCRYCAEAFDPLLEKTKRSIPNRYQGDDAQLEIEHIILAILCTKIALLVAVYWMIRGDPRGLNLVKVVACVIGVAFLLGVSIGCILLLLDLAGMR